MKVTTEACILGAWVQFDNPRRALDIGTGTGLLSLMLAQRYNCAIDAVEIDELAANQARQNFENSNWDRRLRLVCADIKDYSDNCTDEYDLIISNPPFFNSSLKSKNEKKNLAIHNDHLSQELLLKSLDILLSKNGIAYILYPEFEANQFVKCAHNFDLFARGSLLIRNLPEGPVFRKIIMVSRMNSIESEEQLVIYDKQNQYTPAFIRLLRPYYLHL